MPWVILYHWNDCEGCTGRYDYYKLAWTSVPTITSTVSLPSWLVDTAYNHFWHPVMCLSLHTETTCTMRNWELSMIPRNLSSQIHWASGKCASDWLTQTFLHVPRIMSSQFMGSDWLCAHLIHTPLWPVMYHCTLATIYITADCILSWPPVTKCGIDYHTDILHVHLETCQANTGPLTREPVIGLHRLWPLNICVPLHTGHLHKYITGGILLFFGLHTLLLCCLCISCNLCTDKFWADMPRYPEYSSWALWPLRKIQNTQAEHYSPWEMQYVALHTLCTIKKF